LWVFPGLLMGSEYSGYYLRNLGKNGCIRQGIYTLSCILESNVGKSDTDFHSGFPGRGIY